MNVKGLTVYNITKSTWFDYYLGVTESEQEVIDDYGTKEELSDICQMTADISNEGYSGKLGKVTIALFEGMGNWLEVGFTECSEEFKKSLENADAIELDIDGIGFDGSTLKERGYEINEDAFTKGNIIEVMTTIANFVNDVILKNKAKNEKLITEAPDQYGLPTDDEIEAEERAEFEKRLADRKAQRDADFKKKDDERISKEKADQRKAELKAKADEVIKELGTNPDFKDAFDKLVPSSGPCESVGAELIRAANRLEYRWWNDGDRFYDGYGLETCGSPAAFIYDNADEYGAETGDEIVSLLVKTAEKDGTDSDYDDFIDALKERIIKLVFEESPELLAEPLGEKDIHSWADGESYWGSFVPTQEWEIEVSDKVKYYLDRGDVDSWAIVDYILNHVEDIVRSNSYTKKPSVNRPYTNADETYTVTNLSKDAYNELENIDTDEFWNDLEQELEDDYGPLVYTEDLEDQCYERLENLKSDFESDGYNIDISGVSVSYDYGDYICEFDLTVNGQYLGGVDFTFTITADEIDADEFDIDAKTNIEDKIETDYEEETDESLKESDSEDSNFKFNKGDKAYTIFASFASGNKHLYEPVTIDDRWNDDKWGNEYSFTHKSGDKCSKCPEKLLLTKDELDKEIAKGSLVVEGNLSEAYNNEEMKEFMNLCNKLGFTKLVDIDKFAKEHGNVKDQELLQAMRDAVNGANESLKEDYNYDEDAFYQAYNNGDIYCQIVKDDDDDDFMIVDDYEEVQKIQKLLSPNFEPKDKYDTSVLDNFMSWGFSDSYSSCDNCGKLISTEPDSKHWTPDFFVSDYGLICGDCVRKNPQEYLQSLANNPESANTILSESELEDAGFVKLDGDYQNGWYDRQDDPSSILDDLLDRFPNGVFIFNITAQAQFATNFDVWGEEGTFDEYDEDEETDESLKEANETDKYVIYKENGKIKGTVKSNYDAEIRDANKISSYDKFNSTDDVVNYLIKYSKNKNKDDYIIVDESKKKDATIKIKPNSKKVIVDVPDNSKVGEEGNPIQQGLKGRVGKLEDINESANSMADAVSKNTKDFTKEKGQIICNKGAQQEDAESILKKHYSNVESKPAKGGRISISFSDLTKNEALKEEEIKKVFTDEEVNDLTKSIYDTLEDNGIYSDDAYIWNYDTYAQLQVTISGDWKHEHLFAEDLIEDIVKSKGYKITNTEEDVTEENGSDSYTSIYYVYLEK